MRRWLCAVLAAVSLFALSGWKVPARADAPSRYIAIVYDDSASMRYDGADKDVNRNYIYANYALQNLVALMGVQDQASVFLMSDQGEHPFNVERSEDLSESLKRATTDSAKNMTYATAIDAALRSGGQFLQQHPDGQLLFVMMTDGDTMFDGKNADITKQLGTVFPQYVNASGIASGAARSRAMLFSISKGQPLSPVTDLQTALQQAGLPVSVFSADITDPDAAGRAIVTEMSHLADAMAQTSRLDVNANGAFTAQYPLTSLMLMVQADADSAGEVTAVTDAAGAALTLERLYRVRTALKSGPAATYYRVRSTGGDIKPGGYRIAHTGDLIAFPIVHLSASVVLRNAAGATVAQLSNGRWTPDTVALTVGDTLQGEASLAGSDNQPYAPGNAVRVEAAAGPWEAAEQSGGKFQLRAAAAGEGTLALTLSDLGSFQLALPALPVRVSAAATAQPAADATAQATAAPAATASPADNFPVVSEDDLKAITAATVTFPYTDEPEYRQVAAFRLSADEAGAIGLDFGKGIPAGLQVRVDGQPLDAAAPALTFQQGQPLEVSLWVNGSFASGPLALPMNLQNGQQAQWNLQPVPRKFRMSAQPTVMHFSVLSGVPSEPIIWTLAVEQDGKFQPVASAQMKNFQILTPQGFTFTEDRQAQQFTLRSPALGLLSPVGHQLVVLSADTGKPGEAVRCEVALDIQDSPLKYALPAAVLLVLALLAAYLLLLRAKPRLSMNLEVWKSNQPTMQGAERVPLRRDNARRNLWPFGRETARVDALEIYAHPKDRKLVILSSACVQYGLRIDDKGPQYYKAKDPQGDYILSGDNIVTVRGPGNEGMVCYRFVHNGEKEK